MVFTSLLPAGFY